MRMDFDGLDRRIDERSRWMWDAGLLDETRGLVGEGLREGRTARRAVGYAEALRCLDGELSPDEARDLTAQRTRRLARRQARWFLPDERVRWIDGAVDGDEERVVKEALDTLGIVEP
jgi:tRNA dimethylallyltransferase